MDFYYLSEVNENEIHAIPYNTWMSYNEERRAIKHVRLEIKEITIINYFTFQLWTSYCCPFAGNGHEVPFHSVSETCFIKRWLDDCRSLAANNHRKTFTDTFHLLQDIILAHEVDDAHYKFHSLLVNSNQD
jgi:hypothetical protein